MPDFFFDLSDPGYIETSLFLDPAYHTPRNLSQVSQGLTGQDLHLKPLLELALLGPDPSHLRATVTTNHPFNPLSLEPLIP